MLEVTPFTDTRIIGFKLNGKIDKNGIVKLSELLENKKGYDGLLILGEIEDIGGFEDIQSFLELVGVKIKAIGNVKKYAVVTEKKWIDKMVDFFRSMKLLQIEIEHFSPDEKEKALKWLLD
ncbi:SpoIIAA family protein [Aureibacter tunicatorum]|uniref:STAS/SEC14 domain-containing protein n=1 Tax=Aureibacter tunicatorum TaxID=866807 RepID=A0AAE3XKQ0_9BACT|nr:STAS/SEC14 domain-containing protein [Aureibacter tunicatorum]MDR6238207.1 hypothetical protein [Aureibacter tunicatorum]BDD03240.1 hypothetical protein AUTU_07230 [Aureibacter tunicatorum]